MFITFKTGFTLKKHIGIKKKKTPKFDVLAPSFMSK